MDIEVSMISEINEVLAVLLFGSRVREDRFSRDIDLCVVAPESGDYAELLLKIFSKLWKPGYDILLFEELPLYMKVEVVKNHKVIFCRDYEKLYEYFSRVMALWRDQRIRVETYGKMLLERVKSDRK